MTGLSVDDIVQTLRGLTVERKPTLSNYFQAFNSFVATHDGEISKNVVGILAAFRPRTQLEKNLRCRLIDKYRVSSELVVSLRSGDSYYLKQALKCNWFFYDCSDPNFVSDTVPTLSYSARVKVINKFASCLKNSKAGEKLYCQTKSRYGTNTALPLLPSCGENFIRNELPNLKISLPPGVASLLYKKYPSLASEYFKYLVDNKIPKSERQKRVLLNYSGVFTKLATKDVQSFLELYDDHHCRMPSVKLGRRPTKKLIKFQADKIVSDYRKYRQILVDKTFIPRLSLDQLKKLYAMSILPGNVIDFLKTGAWHDLKLVKWSVRSELILSSFKMKYGREVTSEELLYELDESWMKYLPLEPKKRWLQNKISSTNDPVVQSQFIAHLPIDQSIPQLRKLIESQSNNINRAQIAKYFIFTLQRNRCSSGIKDFFAYIVKRFRNEMFGFRNSIVYEMTELNTLYLELETSDWAPIDDFIDIIKLNNEIKTFKYKLRQIYSHRVHGCHLKKGDVETCLANYLDFEREEGGDLDSNALYLCENTPFYKNCLQWFLKEIPKMTWIVEERKLDATIQLAQNIVNYNKKEPKDRIDLPDWVVDYLERYIASSDPIMFKCSQIVAIFTDSGQERLFMRIMDFPKYADVKMVCSLLSKSPDKLMANIRVILVKALTSTFNYYRPFYKKSLLYETYGIPGEIRKFCRVVLKLEQPEYHIDPEDLVFTAGPHAIQVLSMFEPTETFVQLVTSYVPDKPKIEKYSTEMKKLYEIQGSVCKSFINVSTPSSVLPTLRLFAVGDYLKLVVSSLINVCNNVPEKDALPLFKEWVDCPVSLRKHFFRLIFTIAPIKYAVEFFVNVFKTEKDYSLRLILFLKIFQTFVNEPSDESFDTLKSVITQLTAIDKEALNKLFEIDDIEESYVSQYLPLLWNLVNTIWEAVIVRGQTKIITLVSQRYNILKCLSEEFLYSLLSHDVSSNMNNFSDSAFIYNYLLWAPTIEIQRLRFDKLWRLVKPNDNKWDDCKFAEGSVFPERSNVKKFVSRLSTDAVYRSNVLVSSVQLLNEVKTSLSSLRKQEHLLNEMIVLDLAVLQLREISTSGTTKFATQVAQLYDEYLKKYSEKYGHSLVDALINCTPSNITDELALELITKYSDPLCQIIGIRILETNIDQETRVPLYKSVIDVLTTSEHLGVQLAANTLFSSLTSSII